MLAKRQTSSPILTSRVAKKHEKQKKKRTKTRNFDYKFRPKHIKTTSVPSKPDFMIRHQQPEYKAQFKNNPFFEDIEFSSIDCVEYSDTEFEFGNPKKENIQILESFKVRTENYPTFLYVKLI